MFDHAILPGVPSTYFLPSTFSGSSVSPPFTTTIHHMLAAAQYKGEKL